MTRKYIIESISDDKCVDNELISADRINDKSNVAMENSEHCNLSQTSEEGIVESDSNWLRLELDCIVKML